MSKIATFLWYDHQAEEAATFYTKVFGDARILDVHRQGEAAMTVVFEIHGHRFIALNGGPGHPFTDAISLYVDCETQDEVDALWATLTADGGEEGPCGWLTDKYGVSWQIIPKTLPELLSDPDPDKSGRVVKAMLSMKKINVQALRDAYNDVQTTS